MFVELPVELEGKIFELAFLQNPLDILSLLLVCKRIYTWIEPLRFRTVRLNDSAHSHAFMSELRCKPAAYFERHVKSLMLESDFKWTLDDVCEIMGKCQGIIHFGTTYRFNEPILLGMLASMRVRSLTLSLGPLFAFVLRPIDSGHAALAHTTHLVLHDKLLSGELLLQRVHDALPGLPALTHLRLKLHYRSQFHDFAMLLKSCPRLQILLLNSDSNNSLAWTHLTFSDPDPRLVVSREPFAYSDFWKDWEVKARGGIDLWARAEDFVAQKRAGLVEMTDIWLPSESI
ncbi:hypothetical protein MIND_00803200 [Mycena indigotica]|uniref:F-box domain-containing protein n=1 Tax=Mycena indigotica TaxID=2126181 RepID=A0A8H6SFD5_9AGAR|nr:uncharacterized protein MIND_00803200 [Mycena indigotica]KAF7298565.1 hypothetical protein MIND_00803200 [Mycena indigotica]